MLGFGRETIENWKGHEGGCRKGVVVGEIVRSFLGVKWKAGLLPAGDLALARLHCIWSPQWTNPFPHTTYNYPCNVARLSRFV